MRARARRDVSRDVRRDVSRDVAKCLLHGNRFVVECLFHVIHILAKTAKCQDRRFY
jgi:hypothetical protein